MSSFMVRTKHSQRSCEMNCEDNFWLDVVEFRKLSETDIWRWKQILENADSYYSAFLSYEFAKATNDANPGKVYVVKILSEDGVIGYFPFQFRSKKLKLAEKLGGHMADYFGVIVPNEYKLPIDLLIEVVGIHSFRFDHAPQSVEISEGTEIEESKGLRIDIGDDYRIYLDKLKATNPSFVKKVRRRERQLSDEFGPIRFEWNDSSPEETLSHLVKIKKEQYVRSGVQNALKEEWTVKLLYNLLASRSESCQVVMSKLYAGSTWIATNYGIRSRQVLHSWFPVFNTAATRFGPGHVMKFNLIAHAVSEGVTVIDLGQGVNPHKKEYLVSEYVLRKGVLRRSSIFGVADKIYYSLKWRLQAIVRAANRQEPYC